MSVQTVISSIDSNRSNTVKNKLKPMQKHRTPMNNSSTVQQNRSNVAFTGGNPISGVVVGLMDFIDAGGYAASFILQDGLGFIAPRVGKGLLRGGEEKKDENGNVILDKDGNPEHKLNWAFARKEALRELITGPSAFVIPMGMLSVINKYFGTGNSVKLNYLDAFQKPFVQVLTDHKNNAMPIDPVKKSEFYRETLSRALDVTINTQLPDAEKMSAEEIADVAKRFADKQMQIEAIQADKSLSKKARKAELQKLGSLENDFMQLMKNKVGGTVDETAILFKASNGKVKGGGFSEFVKAMNDYFGDALKNTKKSLKAGSTAENIENAVKHFTNKRMGSRVFTNLGIFATVAAFYTQIPKLYNMGLEGNPALANNAAVKNPSQKTNAKAVDDKATGSEAKKDVAFTGLGSALEKTGKSVFGGSFLKSISDIFELNGPIMSGTAMTALLYGFCIPPRLFQAQDKYDYQEIVVRDFTAFTALLFGAKALARGLSDGFTKLTGLALNKKNMEGRNFFQKCIDYLNPNDKRHSVLSSKQLDSKYTNIENYRNGVGGFMEFIENSGGNVKKAFAKDENVKAVVEEILQEVNGKSYKDATAAEIKQALKVAHQNKDELIKKFYKLFEGDNGLLRAAKTCNSTFGFVSTILLVPGLIVWLTHICEKMTEKAIKQDTANQHGAQNVAATQFTSSNAPSMAGFLGQSVR